MDKVKIIECPRDAMQGVSDFIPTKTKISYLNTLLRVGFDTLDFGSFVSPKAIPQLRDTGAVLDALNLDNTDTKLLAIIANVRGAETASEFEQIHYLGFPLSLSETFQQRNTKKSIEEAFATVESISNLGVKHSKTAVIYLSMGFGNPYGDPYESDIILAFVDRLAGLGIRIVSLSDTVGIASSEEVKSALQVVISAYPAMEFGAHLHVPYDDADEKLAAVFESGCRRVDGALRGFGGCPMAKDDLVGNMPTERIIDYLGKNEPSIINRETLKIALDQSLEVFNS